MFDRRWEANFSKQKVNGSPKIQNKETPIFERPPNILASDLDG
jgi:hypothetical protein